MAAARSDVTTLAAMRTHITPFAVLSFLRRWAAQRHFWQSTVPPRVLAKLVAAPFFESGRGTNPNAENKSTPMLHLIAKKQSLGT